MDSKVMVYSTPTCPWCQAAKKYLQELNIAFNEKDVKDDPNARVEMILKSGQLDVPVFDIEGKIIVGFDAEAINLALKKSEKTTK